MNKLLVTHDFQSPHHRHVVNIDSNHNHILTLQECHFPSDIERKNKKIINIQKKNSSAYIQEIIIIEKKVSVTQIQIHL